MNHHIFKTILLITMLLSSAGGFAKKRICIGNTDTICGELISVAPYRITIDDNHCYLIREGGRNGKKMEWEPFCGVIDSFYYREDYEYSLLVKEFDPLRDTTIHKIKTIASSSTPYSYKKATIQQLKGMRANGKDSCEFMRISNQQVKVDDKLCYWVIEGYDKWWDKTHKWEPFCGELKFIDRAEKLSYDSLITLSKEKNLPLEFPVTLKVEEYNPKADVIYVKSVITPWYFRLEEREEEIAKFRQKIENARRRKQDSK